MGRRRGGSWASPLRGVDHRLPFLLCADGRLFQLPSEMAYMLGPAAAGLPENHWVVLRRGGELARRAPGLADQLRRPDTADAESRLRRRLGIDRETCDPVTPDPNPGRLEPAVHGATRLPLTAGWDHLIPDWFTRLHPRYRTPTHSIYVTGAVIVLLLVLASAGVHAAEAFGVLNDAISAGGIAAMLCFLVLNTYPFVDVRSPGVFAAKVLGTLLVVNVGGYMFYRRRGGPHIVSV